jgi:hypothetical protein
MLVFTAGLIHQGFQAGYTSLTCIFRMVIGKGIQPTVKIIGMQNHQRLLGTRSPEFIRSKQHPTGQYRAIS